MKHILGFPVNARRFRLSLLAAGLFSLSFSVLAESVTIGGANFTELYSRQYLRQRTEEKEY